MNQEQAESRSPFAALTWQEQQDQWLAWRSRQLDFQQAGSQQPAQEKPRASVQGTDTRGENTDGGPRLHLPNMRIAAPTRHQELDQVINRHRQALKNAGAFTNTSIG
ncbi:MAG: hypothetical protein IKH30_09665 [Clostridia bacterium]|nr:hypothetical protein [Clostridia bacterium]